MKTLKRQHYIYIYIYVSIIFFFLCYEKDFNVCKLFQMFKNERKCKSPELSQMLRLLNLWYLKLQLLFILLIFYIWNRLWKMIFFLGKGGDFEAFCCTYNHLHVLYVFGWTTWWPCVWGVALPGSELVRVAEPLCTWIKMIDTWWTCVCCWIPAARQPDDRRPGQNTPVGGVARSPVTSTWWQGRRSCVFHSVLGVCQVSMVTRWDPHSDMLSCMGKHVLDIKYRVKGFIYSHKCNKIIKT